MERDILGGQYPAIYFISNVIQSPGLITEGGIADDRMEAH